MLAQRGLGAFTRINRNLAGGFRASQPFSTGPPAIAGGNAGGGGGSSLMQRMLAFLAGVGVGCGASFYVIYDELGNSNARFAKQFHDLRKRVEAMEK